MKTDPLDVPRFCRVKSTGEKVEVLRRGHFPDSVMVAKMGTNPSQGPSKEVYLNDLEGALGGM